MRIMYCICAFLLFGVALFAQTSVPPLEQALAELRSDTQARADHQAYPITGIRPDDVREVLAGIKSLDPNEWAAAWDAMGERHMQQAKFAKEKSDAREQYRQAWLDFMFGGWPATNSPGKKASYTKATEAFRAYGALMDPPVEVVHIPFEGKEIVAYLRLPKGARPAPVVMTIGGLDEYKEYGIEHQSISYVAAGVGVLAIDMPGTGESPVKAEIGSERALAKAIDYLATRKEIDPKRIGVQGTSAGGYWSALLAYTEKPRLKAVAVVGGPIDGYFTPEWQLGSWGTKEYLFGLKEARMYVFGYNDEKQFLDGIQRFSLQKRGMLAKPSAPMLVVNGEKDTQVPIADLYLLLRTGQPKFAWVNPTGGHTGRSNEMSEEKIATTVIVPWMKLMLNAAN